MGCRISGKINYSLKDVIIILQPISRRIRSERLFIQNGHSGQLKGIDERPKDVRKSIPHFIRKAIDKRKDWSAISSMFGIFSIPEKLSTLSETKEIKKFAEDQGNLGGR